MIATDREYSELQRVMEARKVNPILRRESNPAQKTRTRELFDTGSRQKFRNQRGEALLIVLHLISLASLFVTIHILSGLQFEL